MKDTVKKSLQISFFLLFCIPIFFFSSAPVAKADTISDLTSSVATFVQFVVAGFAGIRNDICSQYLSSGQSQFESTFCGGSSAPSAENDALVSTSSADALGNLSIFSLSGALSPNSISDLVSNLSGAVSAAPASNTVMTTDIPVATTSESVSLPTGLSGSTAANGVSLDDSDIRYWTNIARADNGGLAPLSENTTLDAIAKIRVEDMFTKQYFSHYSPSGDNVSLEANTNGYSYITIGENIALGNFGSSRDLVTAWMNSPGHRANILNTSYTEIGVAAEEGMYQGSEVWISSQVFGEPLSACPSPDASLKSQVTTDQSSLATMSAQLASEKTQLAALATSDQSAYNTATAAYNALADQYNALLATAKTLVSQYNQQVAAFNACIGSK